MLEGGAHALQFVLVLDAGAQLVMEFLSGDLCSLGSAHGSISGSTREPRALSAERCDHGLGNALILSPSAATCEMDTSSTLLPCAVSRVSRAAEGSTYCSGEFHVGSGAGRSGPTSRSGARGPTRSTSSMGLCALVARARCSCPRKKARGARRSAWASGRCPSPKRVTTRPRPWPVVWKHFQNLLRRSSSRSLLRFCR